MSHLADRLRAAMKGFGTDEKAIIQILTQIPDAPHMLKLRQTFDDKHRRSLLKDLKSELGGKFETGAMALARGPLDEDVYLLHEAIAGPGTNEAILNDVLLGRSNADMNAIKQAYHRAYQRDLTQEVKGELSGKTEDFFVMILKAARAEESAPCIPQEIEYSVDRLQQATEGTSFGANQEAVNQIISHSSDGQLRAISQRYHQKYSKHLDDVLRSEFSGHLESALRLMLARAVDRVRSDAAQIEESMSGLGTRDTLLISRMIRAHWSRAHMQQVEAAFQAIYKTSLRNRIKGETSGDYEYLLVSMCI